MMKIGRRTMLGGSIFRVLVASLGHNAYTVQPMTRRVVITGLGPVSALGIGMQGTWESLLAGKCALGSAKSFDATGLPSHIVGEVGDFKITSYVPKSYRKATKVMANDIELAVAGADQAARDAKLLTKGTDPDGGKNPDFTPTYAGNRIGCHIGAGLIAADLDELTLAFDEARDEAGYFDIHIWGESGMQSLTPLWLLKYLPNMLACHVTIIHQTNGPSNTITCAEASSELSIGESLRVIQRDAADLCFCGGTEDKINPMGMLRESLAGRLNSTELDDPSNVVRPFSKNAVGTALGEGGGIVILESIETFEKRREADDVHAYAEVLGFGASQSVNREKRNLEPDADGRGIASAIKSAMREASVTADQIDAVLPFGLGYSPFDQAEAAGLKAVFGDRLSEIPLISPKALIGNCAAGGGAFDVCVAAMMLHEQKLPATINCDEPLDGLNCATAPARDAKLEHVLTYSTSLGGQNAALVLKRFDG